MPERPGLEQEWDAWTAGWLRVAGVDEAGRGPLAGPVVAAAVILRPGVVIDGVADSKQLSAKRRRELVPRILESALAVGVGWVGARAIDRVNILVATERAMLRSIARLGIRPDLVLVDGRPIRGYDGPQRGIVGGDRASLSIAAASVIAKVWRDELMERLDRKYPQYGFAVNRGYGTARHLWALRTYGPCPIHRFSFAPLKNLLAK